MSTRVMGTHSEVEAQRHRACNIAIGGRISTKECAHLAAIVIATDWGLSRASDTPVDVPQLLRYLLRLPLVFEAVVRT